jgi:hypothetical protein
VVGSVKRHCVCHRHTAWLIADRADRQGSEGTGTYAMPRRDNDNRSLIAVSL